MPKLLNRKEYQYLMALNTRNLQNLSEKRKEKTEFENSDFKKQYKHGITRPMTAKERKKRERIRKKAVDAALSLGLIDMAGLFGKGALKGHASATSLVDNATMGMMIHSIADMPKKPKEP